jgi:hypothetical protein
MNGHRRDEVANDIARGYPTFSPEVDALAAEVSQLSTFNEREALGRELDDWAAASTSRGEWMPETDKYLAEFDPSLVDELRVFLTTRRDELLQRALERGWDVPAD